MVHDHDFGVSHVLSPDHRILPYKLGERLCRVDLPSHGSIGKIGPSPRGACHAPKSATSTPGGIDEQILQIAYGRLNEGSLVRRRMGESRQPALLLGEPARNCRLRRDYSSPCGGGDFFGQMRLIKFCVATPKPAPLRFVLAARRSDPHWCLCLVAWQFEHPVCAIFSNSQMAQMRHFQSLPATMTTYRNQLKAEDRPSRQQGRNRVGRRPRGGNRHTSINSIVKSRPAVEAAANKGSITELEDSDRLPQGSDV